MLFVMNTNCERISLSPNLSPGERGVIPHANMSNNDEQDLGRSEGRSVLQYVLHLKRRVERRKQRNMRPSPLGGGHGRQVEWGEREKHKQNNQNSDICFFSCGNAPPASTGPIDFIEMLFLRFGVSVALSRLAAQEVHNQLHFESE